MDLTESCEQINSPAEFIVHMLSFVRMFHRSSVKWSSDEFRRRIHPNSSEFIWIHLNSFEWPMQSEHWHVQIGIEIGIGEECSNWNSSSSNWRRNSNLEPKLKLLLKLEQLIGSLLWPDANTTVEPLFLLQTWPANSTSHCPTKWPGQLTELYCVLLSSGH